MAAETERKGARLTREGSVYPAFIDQDYPSTSQPATGGQCMVFHPTMDEFRDFQVHHSLAHPTSQLHGLPVEAEE